MKSGRLNTADLSCLHGGHHCAHQYRSTGLLAVFAEAKAAFTSPLNQAMPCASAWRLARALVTAGLASGGGAEAASPLPHAAITHAQIAAIAATRTLVNRADE